MLGDNPGPGTYTPDLPRAGGTTFATHPQADVRKTELARPGPGSYDPKYSVGPAITFGSLTDKKRVSDALPGPGSYDTVLPARPGGTISTHRVKSDLEIALERAAERTAGATVFQIPYRFQRRWES